MSTYPKSKVAIWLSSVLLQVFLVRTVEMNTARYCLPCTFSTRSTDTPLSRFFLSSARIRTTWAVELSTKCVTVPVGKVPSRAFSLLKAY